MYYDDSFHPTADDNFSVVSNDTFYSAESKTNSVKNKNKKLIEDAKRADKDYFCLNFKKNHKKTKIEFYNSGVNIGSKIRDAVTGARTTNRIGSLDEYLFFKVGIAVMNTNTPITIFYDSPEQYERNHKCILSPGIKEKWYERKYQYQSKLFSYDNEAPITQTVIH